MAEYSISSEDDESVDSPTSTPLPEIAYVRRRKRRLKNYLAGALVGLLFTLIETYREV